ncbi:hypothetical protein NQD34_001502 [Periophthalmus magnuspinnatus]|nr:hypothetical protein NQD34_001502 [Periophthalmus magnuspinnatus]
MYEVIVKARGHSFEVYLCETKSQLKRLTVKDLWDKITEEDEDYDSDDYSLYYKGRHLEDEDDSLYEVGIRNGSEIHLVKRSQKPEVLYGASSERRNSMDRFADFDVCILQ